MEFKASAKRRGSIWHKGRKVIIHVPWNDKCSIYAKWTKPTIPKNQTNKNIDVEVEREKQTGASIHMY